MDNQKKYDLPTVPKNNYKFAMIMVGALLIAISLFIILMISKNKGDNLDSNVSSENAVYGEVPADVIESETPNTIFIAEPAFAYVNRYQGNEFPYTESFCKVTADDKNIYYASETGIVKISKEDGSQTVIQEGIFNNLTLVDNKIICIGVTSRGMIGDTYSLAEIDIEANYGKPFTTFTQGGSIRSSINSFAVSEKEIYYTIEDTSDDNIYSLDRRTGKGKLAIEITPNFSDDTYVIKTEGDNIIYYSEGNIKQHNISDNSTKTLLAASKNISIKNNPIQLGEWWISYNSNDCYLNNESIYSSKTNIFTINTNNKNIFIADGTQVFKYNIDEEETELIYEAPADIHYLYIINNELYTIVDDIPTCIFKE